MYNGITIWKRMKLHSYELNIIWLVVLSWRDETYFARVYEYGYTVIYVHRAQSSHMILVIGCIHTKREMRMRKWRRKGIGDRIEQLELKNSWTKMKIPFDDIVTYTQHTDIHTYAWGKKTFHYISNAMYYHGCINMNMLHIEEQSLK